MCDLVLFPWLGFSGGNIMIMIRLCGEIVKGVGRTQVVHDPQGNYNKCYWILG